MKWFYKLLACLCLFVTGTYLFAEGKPWSTNGQRHHGSDNDRIVIKFVAQDEGMGGQESFPKFLFDPVVGDFIQGRSGQWYVVERRTFDLEILHNFDSPSRFTIYLDRRE